MTKWPTAYNDPNNDIFQGGRFNPHFWILKDKKNNGFFLTSTRLIAQCLRVESRVQKVRLS